MTHKSTKEKFRNVSDKLSKKILVVFTENVTEFSINSDARQFFWGRKSQTEKKQENCRLFLTTAYSNV